MFHHFVAFICPVEIVTLVMGAIWWNLTDFWFRTQSTFNPMD